MSNTVSPLFPATDKLAKYWAKRDFSVTSEPRGTRADSDAALSFVVQKHAAQRLHYDFRLELDGVLLSWAVPKGPSFDPSDKRIAIHVEDHPVAYGAFEGTIPRGQYGAGTVIVWDRGTWQPVGDPRDGLQKGKLVFTLHGHKLAGLWELVKIAKPGEKQEPWILFKKRDEFARPKAQYDVVTALPDSVVAKPLTRLAPRESEAPGQRAEPPDGHGIPGAVKADLPQKLGPQFASLATGLPAVGEWLCEIKLDGYRLMTRIENGEPRFITRGGHDWTSKMPALEAQVRALGLQSAWLDGEIVVLGDDGTPDFNALQNAFDRGGGQADIRYFLFDLPFFEGHDLRRVALRDRRLLLDAFLKSNASDHLRFSASFDGDPAAILRAASEMGLEGVIAKRADAPYESRRTESWLKLKCRLRQEFVVCGYVDRSEGTPQVGSLLLGVHDDKAELVSVGSVGTGWRASEAAELKRTLSRLERATPPFAAGPVKPGRWSRRAAGSERWVEPRLVAEVEFAGWTPDGQIRHATYLGLRADKPAKSVTKETPLQFPGSVPLRRAGPSAIGVKVSHGERVIDASSGLTKLDLIRYYESVADWMLPHLKARPCSLVRAPDGVTGKLFFQKHGDKIGIPGIQVLDESLWPGHLALLGIGDVQALVGAAQMNVVEFHTWNSVVAHIDTPDRMIFDLDPGEGTPWSHVQEAATLMRGMLSELGLESWLKTSGGKGLHVVVPIAPKLDYDTVKAFSRSVVQHLAAVIPSRFVAKSGPSNRVGKVFIDYLRNGHGATTVAAFSARARSGLGVSMPVAWEDLARIKSGAHWTVATAREHLSFQSVDPWAAYGQHPQALTRAMKTLALATKTTGR